MADKLEPLNMTGHANTWEEELQEVCAERDALRAELAATREVIEAALQSAVRDGVLPMEYAVTILADMKARLDAATGPRPEPREEPTP